MESRMRLSWGVTVFLLVFLAILSWFVPTLRKFDSDGVSSASVSRVKSGSSPSVDAKKTWATGELDSSPSDFLNVRGRGHRLAFVTSSIKREFELGRNWGNGDPNVFVVLDYNDQSNPFLPTNTWEYSTSYEVIDARPKGHDVFYLVGKESGGEYLLERWKEKKSVLGTKVRKVVSGNLGFSRMEVYRGTSLGQIATIGVDPGGRYLLILHGSPRKLSVMNLATGSTSVLYDDAAVPELDMSLPSLFPRLHVAEGMVWTLEGLYFPAMPDNEKVLFYDYEDDGVLDSWAVYSGPDYLSVYGMDQAVWSDWFIR